MTGLHSCNPWSALGLRKPIEHKAYVGCLTHVPIGSGAIIPIVSGAIINNDSGAIINNGRFMWNGDKCPGISTEFSLNILKNKLKI